MAEDGNDIPGTEAPHAPPAAAPKTAIDAAQPLILGPAVDLLRSRKFLVTVLTLIGVFVLVGMGRLQWAQALDFSKWVIGGWLVAHAAEEGLTNHMKGEP